MPGPGAMSTNNGPAQMGGPGHSTAWGPGLGTGLPVRATGSDAPQSQAVVRVTLIHRWCPWP